MKKYLEILLRCPLFEGITEENLERMLVCLGARVETFDKKYTIIGQGNVSNYISLVLSGTVQISKTDYMGNRSIVGQATESELFLESFACADRAEVPVTVEALTPCEIMFLDARHILHTCKNSCGFHQQLIYNLMQTLARKNVQFYQKMEITSKRTTRERLLSYLSLCSNQAGSKRFQIPFDRQALADYLQVDRSGLSTEIGKLRDEGLIESEKNHFILHF